MRNTMMMAALVAMLMSACGDTNNNDGDRSGDSVENRASQTREERLAEIGELEKRLKSRQNQSMDLNKPLAEQMVREYRDFAIAHSKDSLAPHYLFKAADLSVGLGKYDRAIGYLESVTTEYPDYQRNVEMWLFKGFIYEQHMNQHAKAVEAYEALIDRFPNHRLAKDARASIENLTLSEEELIRRFQEKNAQANPEG